MIYILDTETTGLDPQVDRIVEIAVAGVHHDAPIQVFLDELINPGIPIQPEASAIHHLTDNSVAQAPTFDEIKSYLDELNTADAVFVAHNAPFDRDFLVSHGVRIPADRWIDTCRVAKHLWPDAPGYGNQVLRYWLKLDVMNQGSPHRAWADVMVTLQLLLRESDRLEADSVAHLIKLSQTPVLLRTITFGKHKGKLWRDVDRGYLMWANRQEWDDADIAWTVKKTIAGEYR